MSMMCSVYRLDASQAAELMQFPDSVGELVGYDPLPFKQSLFSRLFGRVRRKSELQRRFEPLPDHQCFDLHQAWHILHFLFTGRNEGGDFPAAFIMSGGQEVGPDQGYGPVRFFAPKSTSLIADFLDGLTLGKLRHAYVAEKIETNEIYWSVELGPEGQAEQLKELWELVRGLKDFVVDAKKRNEPLLISLY